MNTRTNERGSTLYVYWVSFVAAIGGFLFGYDLLVISGAQLFLKSEFALTEAQLGFAVSSATLGCIAGPFLGGWICEWLGRKGALFVAITLFAASAIGTAIPEDITAFNIFRIVGGVGVGLASMASPMYIAELAPARSRGALGFLYQLAIVVGAVISVIVCFLLAKYLDDRVSWRWMFGLEIVPIILFAIFLSFTPKSPRWLAEKNRTEESLQVLTRVNGIKQAEIELKEIKESISQESGTFAELLQPGVRKALLIAILLALFTSLTGWSGIAYYVPTLLQKAGLEEKSDAILQSLYPHIGMAVLTVLAIFLVDRVGRRPLWNITAAAMIFSMTLAGMVFHFNITGPLVLVTILLCAAPHAIGLGPLPWLMMSELQPTRVRAKAVAISTTFLWSSLFVGPMLFPILAQMSEKKFGSVIAVFLIYAVVCVFALLFGIKMLPETKNRTLEEIANSWLK